jgi:hypothetical protein
MGTLMAWIESYRHCDFVQWNPGCSDKGKTFLQFEVRITRGGLELGIYREDFASAPPPHSFTFEETTWLAGRADDWLSDSIILIYDETYPGRRTFGFAHHIRQSRGRSNFIGGWIGWKDRMEFVSLPLAFLGGVFLFLPAIRLVSWRRKCRNPRGRVCRSCGYDLRATPDRCPECGVAPSKAKSVPN